jgi:hypothetical protein
LVMKTPRGLVSARITKRKKQICSQPFGVIGQKFSGLSRAVSR